MIHAEVMTLDDVAIRPIWLNALPRAGEVLWFTAADWSDLQQDHGSTAFKVVQVAHWVTSTWSPSTHTGNPVHRACLYVEPVQEDHANEA